MNRSVKQAVINFVRIREAVGHLEFRPVDLFRYAEGILGRDVSPDSPMRRLRELRDEGRVEYELLGKNRMRIVA